MRSGAGHSFTVDRMLVYLVRVFGVLVHLIVVLLRRVAIRYDVSCNTVEMDTA